MKGVGAVRKDEPRKELGVGHEQKLRAEENADKIVKNSASSELNQEERRIIETLQLKPKVASCEDVEMTSPFELFPVEVWAMILGKVEDSKDIQNAFKAFPELEWVMTKTRHLWMSDQAIPHLASWLTEGELLAFRQVCKPWSRAVDKFLENHPTLRPCSPGDLLTGQIWNPDAAPRPLSFPIPFEKHFLNKVVDVQNLLAHFGGHHSERNPFVGRSLQITFDDLRGCDRIPNQILKDYIDEIRELFRAHGHHIWYIFFHDWRLSFDETFPIFWGIVVDLIQLLPNLKGLFVHSQRFDMGDSDAREEKKPPSTDFSANSELEETKQILKLKPLERNTNLLPHLETLQFQFYFNRRLDSIFFFGESKQLSSLNPQPENVQK